MEIVLLQHVKMSIIWARKWKIVFSRRTLEKVPRKNPCETQTTSEYFIKNSYRAREKLQNRKIVAA